MTFEFHPEARIEFIEAIAFYEESREGLGLRLSREVYATISRIIAGTTSWPRVSIAVAHSSREPFYWKDRIK